MGILKNGSVVKMKSGAEAEIIDEFGSGGQGTVYKVSYNGKIYALKWYYKDVFKGKEREFYLNLEENIQKGAPTKNFLWPIEITKVWNGMFGYIMDVRPSGYFELTDFFRAKVHFKSYSAQANAAINIIQAFRELHKSGYAYQDINNGNFFINPDNGEVLICDNDNVSPSGTNLGIVGKQRYMAPEIVTGKNAPDVDSDKFSLAVILFRLLCIDHPLEGRRSTPPCMTKELERKYYGEEPVFVFDPQDDCNRPVQGADRNLKLFWPIYPEYLKELFVRAFSKEVMHLNAQRILEKEWLDAFLKYKASIIKCPHCGEETFAFVQGDNVCIACNKMITIPNAIKFSKETLPLYPGTKIMLWNVNSWKNDVETVLGEVIQNPKNKDLFGIKNLSDIIWKISLPNGEQKSVEKNKVVPIKKGFIIDCINDIKDAGKIL